MRLSFVHWFKKIHGVWCLGSSATRNIYPFPVSQDQERSMLSGFARIVPAADLDTGSRQRPESGSTNGKALAAGRRLGGLA